MAKAWRETTIGELCDSEIVELQTGPFGSQLHAHDYVPTGIPVVPTEAIRDRRIEYSVLPNISPVKAAELSRHRLRPGDILFARRGVQATGHIGFVRNAEDGFVCGTGAIRLRVKRNTVVDPRFLSHVLANPVSISWFKFHAIGATMPNLNEGIIRSFSFALPSFSQQMRIAHILGTLDDKIELNRRMNETLEAMAKALFRSWFLDFDPVRAKAAGRQPEGMDTDTAALFPSSFVDSELGKIPKGWKTETVGEEFNLTMGQSPPGETYNELGEGIPFFQGRADFGFRYPNRRVYCTAPTRFAESGDTLVSVRAPVGDINMAAERCCVGRGVAAIRHKSGSRSYTYYAMRSLAKVFEDFEAEGTVFGCINKDDFQGIKHIMPSASLVKRFEALVFPLDQKIENNLTEASTLAAIRDVLLPKLLSGEMQIPEGVVR